MLEELSITASDGFPLAVQVGGPVHGPALLLLTGQANSHRWWAGLRDGFEHRWRTITFDYRGTGHSRGPVGDWTTASFGADATQVLAALAIASTSVYATSMGGRIAQTLASDRPDLVDRLVLACTSPGGEHAVERSTDVRRRLGDPDLERRLRTLRDLFYTPARTGDSNLLGDPTMSAAEARAHLRASDGHDAWGQLPRISAPTLVLHGTDDLMVPAANAPLIAGRIPGARLHLVPGGRHGFFEEFASRVTPLVARFLGEATVKT